MEGRMFRVTTEYFVAAFCTKNGIVVRVAPILKGAIQVGMSEPLALVKARCRWNNVKEIDPSPHGVIPTMVN